MATNFLDVYTRALSLFKSPTLSRLQSNDLQSFCIIMYNYLQTAITLCNINKEIANKTQDVTTPIYRENKLIGEYDVLNYQITSDVYPNENSIFRVKFSDVIIDKFQYNYETNIITFNENLAPKGDEQMLVSWYNAGHFNQDLTINEITLLSIALCLAWAIQESNNQNDISGFLGDSDFKRYSPSNLTNAKINWVTHFNKLFKQECAKYDWKPKFRR